MGSKWSPAIGIFGRSRNMLDDADDDIVELLRVDLDLTFQIIRLSNHTQYGLRFGGQPLMKPWLGWALARSTSWR